MSRGAIEESINCAHIGEVQTADVRAPTRLWLDQIAPLSNDTKTFENTPVFPQTHGAQERCPPTRDRPVTVDPLGLTHHSITT